MPKAYVARNSFNAGEVSELISGMRSDIQKYDSSCKILENAVPLVEGGAKKMPGTYFAGAAGHGGAIFTASISGFTMTVTDVAVGILRDNQFLIGAGVSANTSIAAAATGGGIGTYTVSVSQTVASEQMQIASTGKSRLAPFQFSTEQGAILEFSAGLVRIWEGATQGVWSLGLALGTPAGALNYNPASSYVATNDVLVGPYSAFLFYTYVTYPFAYWIANPSLGVLTLAAPYGVSYSTGVQINFTTNGSDALAVTATGTSPNQGINIALANATPANNAATAIQAAIRALGTLNAPGNNYIDLSAWTATPDPIYLATPWITAPTLAPGSEGVVGPIASFIAQCVASNAGDQFPVLFDGTFNATYWEAYAGVAQTPIELATPYLETDLFALDCSTQSADVLWIFHEDYPPAVIERLGANSWAYSLSLPGQQAGEPPYRGTLGVVKTGYSALGQSITAISKANPCVVTIAATGTTFADGSRIYMNLVSGMVELNQGEFLVANPSYGGSGAFSFSLLDPDTGAGVDSTGYLAYVSGGFAVQVSPLFSATGDYPACGTLYQERLCVGGSANNPTQMNGSVQADYPDFICDPNADDFAIQFTLVSNQVNQLLNMIGTPNGLLIGTSGGVWVMQGSSGTSLSQTNVNAANQNAKGVSKLQPQLIDGSGIFVSRSSRIVNFFVYNFSTNAWDNNDLTRLNRNITLGTSQDTSGIAQTSFQVEPYPIFWAVRNDGQLIGLVFNTQDQVYAWFRVNMTTEGGYIESCAVISGQDQEDQLVVVVRRTVNGVTMRYVEYFMPQELFGQLSNAFFVRSGLQLQGIGPATITGITNANPPVVSAAAHGFSNGQTVQITGVLGMTEINQDATEAYTVSGVTTDSFELAGMDTTAFGTYTGGGTALQVFNEATGLSYLLGNTVVAVGDGAQILQPTVVTGDSMTFPYFSNLITIGIPYQMTVQPTNPVLSSQGATTRGMPQKMNRASVSLYQSMGGQIGQDLDHLYDLVYEPKTIGTSPMMTTTLTTEDLDYDWSDQSTFYVTQNVPFPFTLRGIIFRMTANPD